MSYEIILLFGGKKKIWQELKNTVVISKYVVVIVVGVIPPKHDLIQERNTIKGI